MVLSEMQGARKYLLLSLAKKIAAHHFERMEMQTKLLYCRILNCNVLG